VYSNEGSNHNTTINSKHSGFFLLSTALSVVACAPVFPREAKDRVDRHLLFRELQSYPDRFKGAWVMLAGLIIEVRNEQVGAVINIMQEPMDSDRKPLDTVLQRGVFWFGHAGFSIQPSITQSDRLPLSARSPAMRSGLAIRF
jgi:starvation-inducible outer membrane lipoprotein